MMLDLEYKNSMNMKSVKVIGYGLLVIGMLFVGISVMAQSFSSQDQLSTTFQSTSTMRGSGSSYSANPTLNSDGTASYPPANGPRRAAMDDPALPPTPNINEGDNGNTPVGEPVLPLLLMAAAAAGVIYLRKRNAHNKAQA